VGLVVGGLFIAGPYIYLAEVGIDASAMIGDTNTEVAGVGFDPIINVGIYPENLLIIAVAVVIATMAAGLYPAWRAGTVVPVDTIKVV
jgi:ABC-type lipoprotein release transport system permease subunit